MNLVTAIVAVIARPAAIAAKNWYLKDVTRYPKLSLTSLPSAGAVPVANGSTHTTTKVSICVGSR